MRILRVLLHKSHYVILSVVVAVMVMWPLIDRIFGDQDKMIPLGVAMGCALVFFAYFERQLRLILSAGQEMRHLGLGDAFREVLSRTQGHVNELRIYALTTEVIQPIIRDLQCTVGTCKVMLYAVSEGRVHHRAQLKDRVAQMGERWRALVDAGRIKSLELVYYEDYPTEYIVAIDDLAVIRGFYTPNDASPHGGDYWDPQVVSNRGATSERYLARCRMWFDTWFVYWDQRARDAGARAVGAGRQPRSLGTETKSPAGGLVDAQLLREATRL